MCLFEVILSAFLIPYISIRYVVELFQIVPLVCKKLCREDFLILVGIFHELSMSMYVFLEAILLLFHLKIRLNKNNKIFIKLYKSQTEKEISTIDQNKWSINKDLKGIFSHLLRFEISSTCGVRIGYSHFYHRLCNILLCP